MDSTLIELVERMQVRVNIMEEEKRQREYYELGVRKMNEAWGVEPA